IFNAEFTAAFITANHAMMVNVIANQFRIALEAAAKFTSAIGFLKGYLMRWIAPRYAETRPAFRLTFAIYTDGIMGGGRADILAHLPSAILIHATINHEGFPL